MTSGIARSAHPPYGDRRQSAGRGAGRCARAVLGPSDARDSGVVGKDVAEQARERAGVTLPEQAQDAGERAQGAGEQGDASQAGGASAEHRPQVTPPVTAPWVARPPAAPARRADPPAGSTTPPRTAGRPSPDVGPPSRCQGPVRSPAGTGCSRRTLRCVPVALADGDEPLALVVAAQQNWCAAVEAEPRDAGLTAMREAGPVEERAAEPVATTGVGPPSGHARRPRASRRRPRVRVGPAGTGSSPPGRARRGPPTTRPRRPAPRRGRGGAILAATGRRRGRPSSPRGHDAARGSRRRRRTGRGRGSGARPDDRRQVAGRARRVASPWTAPPRGQPLRGAYMMIATPSRQTRAPITS